MHHFLWSHKKQAARTWVQRGLRLPGSLRPCSPPCPPLALPEFLLFVPRRVFPPHRVGRLPSPGMPHLPCGLCDSSWRPAPLPQSLGERLTSRTTSTATLPSCAGSALPCGPVVSPAPGLDSSLPSLGRAVWTSSAQTSSQAAVLPRSAPSVGFHTPVRSGSPGDQPSWRLSLTTPVKPVNKAGSFFQILPGHRQPS